LEEAQAWAERTKLTLTGLDEDLLVQIEEEVLDRINSTYSTSTWVDPTTTPRLVRVAIAKKYVVWVYERTYSESELSDSAYSRKLEANAEMIVGGIVDGTIELPGLESASTGEPAFYPTDGSSLLSPTQDDPSLGPAKFSMGMVF